MYQLSIHTHAPILYYCILLFYNIAGLLDSLNNFILVMSLHESKVIRRGGGRGFGDGAIGGGKQSVTIFLRGNILVTEIW